MPIKMTDAEIIKYQKTDCILFCSSCSWVDKGCNTQDTICRTVAEHYPIALTRKDLNNLCYSSK